MHGTVNLASIQIGKQKDIAVCGANIIVMQWNNVMHLPWSSSCIILPLRHINGMNSTGSTIELGFVLATGYHGAFTTTSGTTLWRASQHTTTASCCVCRVCCCRRAGNDLASSSHAGWILNPKGNDRNDRIWTWDESGLSLTIHTLYGCTLQQALLK